MHGPCPIPASPRLACPPAPPQGALLLWDGTLWGSNAAVLAGGWRNSLASPLLADAGVPILPAWNESLPMHELHEPGECTHFCTPGVQRNGQCSIKGMRRPGAATRTAEAAAAFCATRR